MSESRNRTMQQRIDDEFDARSVHFSETMKSQVSSQLWGEELADRERAATQQASFWKRTVAIPLPALLIPAAIAVAFGGVAIVGTLPAGVQPTDPIVVSQGSIYSLTQLTPGETSP